MDQPFHQATKAKSVLYSCLPIYAPGFASPQKLGRCRAHCSDTWGYLIPRTTEKDFQCNLLSRSKKTQKSGVRFDKDVNSAWRWCCLKEVSKDHISYQPPENPIFALSINALRSCVQKLSLVYTSPVSGETVTASSWANVHLNAFVHCSAGMFTDILHSLGSYCKSDFNKSVPKAETSLDGKVQIYTHSYFVSWLSHTHFQTWIWFWFMPTIKLIFTPVPNCSLHKGERHNGTSHVKRVNKKP